MNQQDLQLLTERIDREIEASREQLEADTIRMIAIRSVKGAPLPGAPFGPGPRAMLDEALRMGAEAGFHTRDYGVGVVSMSLKEGQPDLGIWLHGDVVPEGTGWEHPPYRATRYQGCIIGRGATDNKGQLSAIYNLLKIFKKMDIPLRYNLALYVGSDEENGKHDLTGVAGNPDAGGFCKVCTPPRLSLVPDASFPVGYGGKGALNIALQSREPLRGLVITAGLDDDPGKAEAVIGGRILETRSPLRHGAHPDPNGNMITRLMERLLAEPDVSDADRPVLDFFRRTSLDVHGDGFGINVPSEHMTPTTVFCKQIVTEDGRPTMRVNIRYPIELTAEEALSRIEKAAAACGVGIVSAERPMEPYLLDPANPLITALADIANSITGDNKPPYTLGGGTYAHDLPNALVFGMDGCKVPDGYPAGRGGAHGLDELVCVDRLIRAMRIYARALLFLNEADW